MVRAGDIIISEPGEGESGLPDIFVNEVLETLPMSEMTDNFNTQRDWETLTYTGYGEGIRVGVGDTGVDKTHMEGDLKGTIARDFTGSRNGFYDVHSHGTHTTMHIGARKDGKGFFGAAFNSTLFHAKVLGDRGSGSTRGIADGIKWMVDQGCLLINLSLGGGFSRDIEAALVYAQDNGCIPFASMGNSGNRGDGHPGNSRYSQGITAMDYNHRLASFSSRSNMAKYVGYGVQVLSGVTGGRYGRMSGTSMSCPDTVGQAAIQLGYMKKLGLTLPKTVAQYDALVEGCIKDLGPEGHDRGYGLGFIITKRVLEKIKAMAGDPPPEEPQPAPTLNLGLGAVLSDDGILFFSGNGEEATLTVGDKTYKGNVSSL